MSVARLRRSSRDSGGRKAARGVKARYHVRAWAPSPRARRGEVLVRSMTIWTNDAHTAAIELYRLTHDHRGGITSRWRYEVVDHGPNRTKLGEVVQYADLVRRAGSYVARDRHRHRTKGAPTFAQQRFIGRKIRQLHHEGYEDKQAVAIAYRYAGVPKRRKKITRRRSRR